MCFIGEKALSTFSMGPRKGSETQPTEPRQEGAAASDRLAPRAVTFQVPGGVSLLASHGLLCFHLSLLTHTTLTPFLWFLSLSSLATFLPFWLTCLTLLLHLWGENGYCLFLKKWCKLLIGQPVTRHLNGSTCGRFQFCSGLGLFRYFGFVSILESRGCSMSDCWGN